MVALRYNAHMVAIISLLALLVLPGCVTSHLVAPETEPQIARDIPFESLKAEPAKFTGRLVVLGGKVLSAKRLKEGTQIEVLQLPLDRTDMPILNLERSTGRFLAYQTEFLDPAKLPAGTAVSMIAAVIGAKTMPLDEVEYTYPTVTIRTLKIWSESEYWRPWPRSYLYPSPYYRYPFHPFYPSYPYGWDRW